MPDQVQPYTVADVPSALVSLNGFINERHTHRARLVGKYRRARSETGRSNAKWAIRSVDWQIANAASEITALANPHADTQFVTTAGKRYLGVECTQCHQPFQVLDKPIVLTRTNGVWTAHCFICRDAKYEIEVRKK
jgi:hypothetical protein